jgi:hypothetical protein
MDYFEDIDGLRKSVNHLFYDNKLFGKIVTNQYEVNKKYKGIIETYNIDNDIKREIVKRLYDKNYLMINS